MNDKLEAARLFALAAHGNQQYGAKPYIHHLEAVVEILRSCAIELKIIGYLHDVLEDTSVSSGQIESVYGRHVARCVELLTDEPGKSRAERKRKTYVKMSKAIGPETQALIVKAADRLANVEACIRDNRYTMLAQYKCEHADFKRAVYRPGLCDAIWSRLDAYINNPDK